MKTVEVNALALAAVLDYFEGRDDLSFVLRSFVYQLEKDFEALKA